MRHTALQTTLTALAVLAASTGASAQNQVRIPHITNLKQPAAAPAPTTGSNATFAYVSTPSLRKQVLDSYLAQVGRKNPERAKMLAADFAHVDVDQFYAGLISKTGLHNYDAADSLTAYQLTGWIIANNIKTLPPRSQILAARRQTAAILSRDPRMADRNVRARTGEQFKLLIVTLHLGLLAARHSGATLAYADEMASLFAETGPNPRTLRLTDAGFVRK